MAGSKEKSIIKQYISEIYSADSIQQIAEKTISFLKKHNPGGDKGLVKINSLSDIEGDYNFKLSKSIKEIVDSNKSLLQGESYTLCKLADRNNLKFYILFSDAALDAQLIKICSKIGHLVDIIFVKTETEIKNNYANLISQLLHDVSSLMNSVKDEKQNELDQRIAYQKKLNKRLLFYIRDIDLFKSPIEINSFIKDSFSLLGLGQDLKTESKIDPNYEINVDVELFSYAFNEIIQNALDATENDLKKIKVQLDFEETLLNKKILSIKVSDRGKSISKDYFDYIKTPYFTTKKYEGKSGFGLSIAEKIITAHGGSLEITIQHNTKYVHIKIPV